MKSSKYRINFIAQEFFQFSLITYLILFLIEVFKKGFVSFFFNINILLVVVVVSGIVMAVTHHEKIDLAKVNVRNKIKGSEIEYIVMLSALGAWLVFLYTQEMGIVSYVISGLTALFIVLLSMLLITEK